MIRFKEGDFVRLVKRNHGHAFNIGETVMISTVNGDYPEKDCCDVYSPGWQNNPGYSVFNKDGYCMTVVDCELEKSTKEDFYKQILFRRIELKKKLNIFKAKNPSILVNWNLCK